MSTHFSSKTNVWKKLLSVIFALAVGLLIIRGFWWYMDYDLEKTRTEIQSNPVYSSGIIVSRRTYKGKGIDIEYFVNGKRYILKTGITTEFYKKYKIWDSVDIVYSKKNPGTALLKEDFVPSN